MEKYNPAEIYDNKVSFEVAIKAKQKGFEWKTVDVYATYKDDLCIASYEDAYMIASAIHCYAPSQSILQKWLRDEHNIDIIINRGDSMIYGHNNRSYYYTVIINNYYGNSGIERRIDESNVGYETSYENALERAIAFALDFCN